MIETTPSTVPTTFVGRRRLLRTAAAVTSSGVLAGLGVTAAAPAFAATAADCNAGNTVDASTGDAADIQTLLDADTAIVCLSGTFPLTSTLTFDHDLTLFGLDDATLDGGGSTQLLSGGVGGSIVAQNIAFENGQAIFGGAIYVDGDLEIENSTFTNNESFEDGGAIYVNGDSSAPSVSITGSTFTNNQTGPEFSEFDGYSGGALYVEDSSGLIEIVDSVFTGNEASEAGGAVFAYAAVVDSSTFTDNSAPAGGALYGAAGFVYESTFSENSAEFGGAIASVVYGAAFGSTFVGNEAEFAGGALATGLGIDDGPVGYGAVITLNSTYVSNSAGEVGGAVFADYGQVGFTTFLENRANGEEVGEEGEAIFATGFDGTLQIGGSIFAGSRSNAQLGQDGEGSFEDFGGNVFSTPRATEVALETVDDSTQFSASVSQIFGPSPALANNGGSTQTLRLPASSPAVDAVPEGVFDTVSTSLDAALGEFASAAQFIAAVDDVNVDQRNEPRTTGLSDAGAFELQADEIGSELADTGLDDVKVSLLGGFAALLVGIGAAFAIGTRRLSRNDR